jgi:hypothetical protein
MRMTASWSGSNDPTAYKSVARDPRPMASSPLGLSVGHACAPSDAPASKSRISLVILPPRAQASKPAPGVNRGRCETQAPLSGEPPSCTSVSVPRPLPRAPETWSQATGRRTAFRSEQRNRQQTKRNYLTGKAPYKFESSPLQQRVSELSVLRTGGRDQEGGHEAVPRDLAHRGQHLDQVPNCS